MNTKKFLEMLDSYPDITVKEFKGNTVLKIRNERPIRLVMPRLYDKFEFLALSQKLPTSIEPDEPRLPGKGTVRCPRCGGSGTISDE